MYHEKRDTLRSCSPAAPCAALYGWDQSALKYIELYRKLTGEAAERAVAETTPEAPAAEPTVDASIPEPTAEASATLKKRAPRRKAADGEAAPAKPRAKKATDETAAKPRARKKKVEEPVGE